MCARFSYFSSPEYRERFNITGYSQSFRSFRSYNIGPGTMNPAIIRQSPNKIVMMKWGLIPFWAKDPTIGYKMINARAEGIENKTSFRKPIRYNRCLIPADGFYEWKTMQLEDKPEKIPWYFGLKDRSVFSFAGIFDIWKDAEAKEILSYSIITTEPNSLVAEIHDRMPVILKQEDEDRWLDPKTSLEDVLALLKPFPQELMVSWPVSKLVNKYANDDPSLIKPFIQPEQNTLLD